jgi:hypothetical protein
MAIAPKQHTDKSILRKQLARIPVPCTIKFSPATDFITSGGKCASQSGPAKNGHTFLPSCKTISACAGFTFETAEKPAGLSNIRHKMQTYIVLNLPQISF